MGESRTGTVDELILQRLEGAELPKDAYDLLLTVLLGEDEAAGVGDGSRVDSSASGSAAAKPAGAYLTSIEVQGFRGVGPAATLKLMPGPGLTIVTGRNGSGKSSFAEAAELALTGDNQRWAGRTQEWRDGWRNLHATGDRYIRVGLGLDGHRGGGTVACRWDGDADLDERTTFFQRHGEKRQPVADLGWQRPMSLFRPFLSYAELGGLLGGKPSERYDSLHSVLGLDRLADLERRLKDIRRDSEQERGRAAASLPWLRETLAAHPDPRAREIERLLAKPPSADLERIDEVAADTAGGGEDTGALRAVETLALPERKQVAAVVAGLCEGLQRITELAHTPAARARTSRTCCSGRWPFIKTIRVSRARCVVGAASTGAGPRRPAPSSADCSPRPSSYKRPTARYARRWPTCGSWCPRRRLS